MAQTIVVLVIDPAQGPIVQTIPAGIDGLQFAVGGTERVTVACVYDYQHRLGKGLDIWVDDDGLSKDLPVNFWSGFAGFGPLVGRMVITRSQGAKTVSLTPSDLERLNRLLPPKPEPRIEVTDWPE